MSKQVVKRSPQEWLELVERIKREEPISLPVASRLIPADTRSGHASVSALKRWIKNGRQGVFLEGCRLYGRSWWTSKAAIDRFQAEQSNLGITRIVRRRGPSDRTSNAKTDTGETKTKRTLDRLQKMRPKKR